MKVLLSGSVIFFSLILNYTSADQSIVVNTTYGSLEGKLMKSRGGRTFSAFLGIPFAAPPIGSLRFMPPIPPIKWEMVRHATQEGDACVQRSNKGKEDCLFLNVFSHFPNNSSGTLSTVMVYIHGGGFYGGSSTLTMYGPEYLMDRNIVLVTLQYRLGVFGFLSTEDGEVPGNMGLKDQVQALKWVQGNIKAFGGDPMRVTIFGNSAGSSSVHLHMLSPASKNLFARAISQSGTALSAFSMIGKGTSKNITYQLANSLNCSTKSSRDIIQCLQLKTSEEIQQKYSDLQDSNYEIKKALFRPVVEEPTEHAFLVSSPLQTTTDKPWLVGVNRNEGLFKINVSHLNETIELIKKEFNRFGPAIMFFDDTCSEPAQVADLIYNFYFKKAFTRNEIITSLEQVISDSWFFWPMLQAVEQHRGTLFCYFFNHEGERSFTHVRGGPQGFGVSHMDELHYLFTQTQVFPATMCPLDTRISEVMVNLWVNFSEEINPTPFPISSNHQQDNEEKITWTPSSVNTTNFFNIGTNKLKIVHNIFPERMSFWKQLPVRDKLM